MAEKRQMQQLLNDYQQEQAHVVGKIQTANSRMQQLKLQQEQEQAEGIEGDEFEFEDRSVADADAYGEDEDVMADEGGEHESEGGADGDEDSEGAEAAGVREMEGELLEQLEVIKAHIEASRRVEAWKAALDLNRLLFEYGDFIIDVLQLETSRLKTQMAEHRLLLTANGIDVPDLDEK